MAGENEKPVEVRFTGTLDDLNKAMAKALEGLDSFKTGAQSRMSGVVDAITSVKSNWIALAAVLSGGMFAKSISDSSKLATEAGILGERLGISATEAGALAIALGDIYSDVEAYTSSFFHLGRQLKANEEELQRFGLQTRDASGKTRDAKDIMAEALEIIGQYRTGFDQAQVSMVFFGRSVQEVQKLQRLTPQVMEEARKKAEDLGLTITKQGVAANKEYKAAMNDLDDMFMGIRKTIGDVLMPVVTKLTQWFTSTGPAAVSVIRVSLGTVASMFWGIAFAVESVIAIVEGLWTVIKNGGSDALNVLRKVGDLDFKGAWDAVKNGAVANGSVMTDVLGKIGKAAKDTEQKIKNIFLAGDPTTAPKGGARTARFPKNVVDGFEAELAARRESYEKQKFEQGSFEQFTKQMEVDFWKEKLKVVQQGSKDYLTIQRKIYEGEREMRKAAFLAEIEDLRNSSESWRNNYEQRLAIAQRVYEQVKQRFGAESAAAKSAAGEVARVQRQLDDQRKELNALQIERMEAFAQHEMQLQEQMVAHDVEMRRVTVAQSIESYQQIEKARYDISKEAMEKRRALIDPNLDPVAYRQATAQIEQITREHEQRMMELRRQASVETNKYSIQGIDAVKDATATLLENMSRRVKSLKDILLDFANSVQQAFFRIAANKAVEAFLGSGSTGGNILGSLTKAIFGGGQQGKQFGGSVFPGQAQIVGERRPEIFVPFTGGKIMPTTAGAGGGAINVTNNFTVSGPVDGRSQGQIAAAAGMGLQRAMRRNT